MSTHDPSGTSVCIHAVVVRQSYQRQGIALALLKEYIARLKGEGKYDRALLICHDGLQELYEKAGFECVGASDIVHGTKPWIELHVDLKAPNSLHETLETGTSEPIVDVDLNQGGSVPPNILQALQGFNAFQAQSPLSKQNLSAFEGGISAVTSESRNKYDLICPHPECRCKLLKGGVGILVEEPLFEVCFYESLKSKESSFIHG